MKYKLDISDEGIATIVYGEDKWRFDIESSHIIIHEVELLNKVKRVQIFLKGVCIGASLTRR